MKNDLSNPDILAKSLEARKVSAKLKREMINKKGRAKDVRNPGDCRSIMDSVSSFCSECITGYGDDTGGAGSVFRAVETCTAIKCHLWPWRNGKAHPEDVIAER